LVKGKACIKPHDALRQLEYLFIYLFVDDRVVLAVHRYSCRVSTDCVDTNESFSILRLAINFVWTSTDDLAPCSLSFLGTGSRSGYFTLSVQ